MGTPGVQQSPWSVAFPDYQGNAITITLTFNNSTRALTGGTVVRDAGCVYSTIVIGDPATTQMTFQVPFGSTTLKANQLSNKGLNTIEDVLALQITAE